MADEPETPKCDECGTEVTETEGGHCILCLRPYCSQHLASKSDPGPLCKTCGAAAGG